MRIQAKWSVLLVAGLYAASCAQSAKKRNIKDIIETPGSSTESSSFQSLAKELRLASEEYLNNADGKNEGIRKLAKGISNKDEEDLAEEMAHPGLEVLDEELSEDYQRLKHNTKMGLTIGGATLLGLGVVGVGKYLTDAYSQKKSLQKLKEASTSVDNKLSRFGTTVRDLEPKLVALEGAGADRKVEKYFKIFFDEDKMKYRTDNEIENKIDSELNKISNSDELGKLRMEFDAARDAFNKVKTFYTERNMPDIGSLKAYFSNRVTENLILKMDSYEHAQDDIREQKNQKKLNQKDMEIYKGKRNFSRFAGAASVGAILLGGSLIGVAQTQFNLTGNPRLKPKTIKNHVDYMATLESIAYRLSALRSGAN